MMQPAFCCFIDSTNHRRRAFITWVTVFWGSFFCGINLWRNITRQDGVWGCSALVIRAVRWIDSKSQLQNEVWTCLTGITAGRGDMAWNMGPKKKKKITACQPLSSQLMACKGKWRPRDLVWSFGHFKMIYILLWKDFVSDSIDNVLIVRWNFLS